MYVFSIVSKIKTNLYSIFVEISEIYKMKLYIFIVALMLSNIVKYTDSHRGEL